MRYLPFILVAAVALLATGCGSKSSSGVANVASGTTTAATVQNGPDAFSQCMRANGVSSFPDPQHFPDGSVKLVIHAGQGTPHFQAAMRACSHLLPSRSAQTQSDQQTRTQIADELSFARCVRHRGVSRFPDPNASGLTVAMVQAQGIDVHSPQVLRVIQACLPASHGGLTAAKVREALANAGH